MENLTNTSKLELRGLKEQYLEYIDVSNKTIETYDIAIGQFINYLYEKGIQKPTRKDVIEWRDYLKENHSVATVNSYLIAVRNLFKYLQYIGIYKNITENIKGLKDTDIHKREALDVETCRKLIASAKNLKEKALFLLAVSCGLRANEIVNIELKDFKEEENQVRLYVLGKGRDSKLDYVIVPEEVINVIKEYIQEYSITNYLFVSNSNHNKGGQLNTRTIRRIINAMYERLGIKSDTIVLHSLRHTFATISLQNGMNIREVSQAMRHANIATTERYAHDLEIKNNKCSNTVTNCILGGDAND